MRVLPVLIVRAVVHPFREYLSAECVPVSVKQGIPLCLWHGGKAFDVIRVILQQGRVVKNAGRNKDAALHGVVFLSGWVFPGDILPDGLHRLRGGNKPLLYPSVADASRVGGCADINAGSRSVWAVPGEEVAVFLPGEVRQLVKCDKVIGLALVLCSVLGVLHGAEDYLRTAGECPGMCAAVVLGLRKHAGVVVQRLVDQFSELVIGLSQDQRLVVANMHLPERFNDNGVRFPAAGGAAIKGLILRAGHEHFLPRLRLPDDVFTSHRSLPPA